MTRVSPMPPDLPGVIADLRQRIDSLERTQPQATTPQYRTGLTWTMPTDHPIRAPSDFRAESLWADTGTAVAATTTFQLRRNGTAVGSVTIATGDTHGHATLDPPVVGDVFDVFTVEQTAGSAPATIRVLGRSTSPDSPAAGGNGCSPVPGGSLQTDETIDTVTTGNALVACDTTLTSSGLDQWLTATNFTWTAAKACTVFVSFSAFVESGGTVNTLTLSAAGGAGGVAATAGDAVTLSASDIVTLDAADTLQLILTHDGGDTASVSGARFNVLIVCAASGGSIPD